MIDIIVLVYQVRNQKFLLYQFHLLINKNEYQITNLHDFPLNKFFMFSVMN